jgi:hypothetical protein
MTPEVMKMTVEEPHFQPLMAYQLAKKLADEVRHVVLSWTISRAKP